MLVNENEKRVVVWCTYGDDVKYFLSQEYYYEGDEFFDFEDEYDKEVLVNERITDDNTFQMLLNKTKKML